MGNTVRHLNAVNAILIIVPYFVYSIQVRYSRGDKQHAQARDEDPIALLLMAHRTEEAEIGAESEQNKYLAVHKSSEDIRLPATIGEVCVYF